ncbi:succinate dehydrogenase flavoprotein subunit [Trypanosoma conorhini]|uniref:Succinate dehydrogenase flavoprotein subunit n=1 Tax=Trypanosoma conorhini TaxID=83891 RepID=A0A3R7JVU5_9TRYP|nr:succinate dehydrogenase flavoprotein subunit [Trypanosoma conorhini]RNE97645.1 succinate dehydrogenase flavoprotein subunit [Trypanosoma conorhini]
MFHAGTIFRAALASHRPVLESSVSTRALVRRLLGDKGGHVPNIAAVDSVITKTKGQGLPGLACIVGRAAFYVRCRNPEAAIAEIDKVFSEIQDADLKRFALGIRLRARNDLLDVKEAALKVDGGSTELDVSTLRGAIREDYAALKAASSGCWLVEMAAAEYALYEGKTEEAYKALCDVEEKIEGYIASLGRARISTEAASVENTQLSSLLAFLLKRAEDAEGVNPSASKIVEDGIKNILKDDSVKETLSAFKKELGVSLTDEEVAEVAYVLDAAHIRPHFHDYFPLEGEYNDWHSVAAKEAKRNIAQAIAPQPVALSNEILENVKKSVPYRPFYAPEDSLRKFLSSSNRKNYLAELRAAFGSSPESVLAKSDEAYFEALKVLKQAPPSADTAGDPSYPQAQNEVCRKLARQLLYRTKVNEAVALTQLDRLNEAIELLNGVIAANEFVYMWRAFLARAEANKRLGLISKSDKDFRQLSQQKKSSR